MTATELSPAIAARTKKLRAKVEYQKLTQSLRELESTLTDDQNEMAAIVLSQLLSMTGSDLGTISKVVYECKAEHEDAVPALSTVNLLVSGGRWDELATLVIGPAESKPEPAKPMDGGNPYPKRTAKAKPATSEASPPEIKDDMVRMLAGQMAPLWDHRVRVESENLLSNIEPMISELSKKLDDSIEGITSRILKTPAASTLDPEAVKTLVKHCLANGEGEEIKKLVAKQGPAVFADILEKAARAIASTAPDDEAKAELTATYVPKPDPFYSWSDDLKETAELVNEIRSKPPEGAVNILLVGPTGAGKTEFSFQLAAMFKLPCIKMDCPNVREARDWFGVKGASGGRTYFRKSQFWLAVEAGNCVIILDEFNRVADHIRNPLMALLDHTRTAHVEEAGVLKVGPGTVFAATMNEGLDYSGTHSTDRAMKNRFCRRIELDYLPEDREVSVLCDKVPGIKKHHATMLVQVAGVIRSKAASFGGLSETLSTRQLLAAASDFVIKGADSFRSTVFNHFSSDGGDTSERKQVVNMFQLKGLLSK